MVRGPPRARISSRRCRPSARPAAASLAKDSASDANRYRGTVSGLASDRRPPSAFARLADMERRNRWRAKYFVSQKRGASPQRLCPRGRDGADEMTTTVLAASGVWKSYDGRADVLRDVNLEARAAEAVLIWGANGSGKTTLLSILGGLDIPTKGSVLLGGREIARLKESELAKVRLHDVGFVFQTHNLIDDLTVEENVALPLRLARRPADARV